MGARGNDLRRAAVHFSMYTGCHARNGPPGSLFTSYAMSVLDHGVFRVTIPRKATRNDCTIVFFAGIPGNAYLNFFVKMNRKSQIIEIIIVENALL